MSGNRALTVHLGQRLVGTLAETVDRRVAFAYDRAWLKNGFSMSPPCSMASQSARADTTSGRSRPWVSDNTPIFIAIPLLIDIWSSYGFIVRWNQDKCSGAAYLGQTSRH